MADPARTAGDENGTNRVQARRSGVEEGREQFGPGQSGAILSGGARVAISAGTGFARIAFSSGGVPAIMAAWKTRASTPQPLAAIAIRFSTSCARSCPRRGWFWNSPADRANMSSISPRTCRSSTFQPTTGRERARQHRGVGRGLGRRQRARAARSRRRLALLARRESRRDPVHQHDPYFALGRDRRPVRPRQSRAAGGRAALSLRPLQARRRPQCAEQRGLRRQPARAERRLGRARPRSGRRLRRHRGIRTGPRSSKCRPTISV